MGLFSLKTTSDNSSRLKKQLKTRERLVWEKNCEELLNRYVDNSNWERGLKAHLEKLYPNNFAYMADNILTLNIVKKIVDRKARLYRKSPTRDLMISENVDNVKVSELERLKTKLIKQSRLDSNMKTLLQYYELFNSAVLWGQADFAGKKPFLCVLAPHYLLVEANPDAPDKLSEAKAIYIPLHHNETEMMGYVKYSRYFSFGRFHLKVEKLDADFNPEPYQPEEFERYSLLEDYPFVVIKKDCLMGEMFPDVPHGLLRAAKWLDHEFSRGALNSRQSDFPAYTYNGSANELGPVNPITGAGSIICLGDEDKKIKKLEVDAREEERNNNILFYLKLLAQASDISPSTFTFNTELLSGTAKFHDKQPEIEYREELIEKIRPVEEMEIWPLLVNLAIVADFENADALTEVDINVVFPESVIPLSEEERLKNLKTEIELGLTTAEEIIAKRRNLPLITSNNAIKTK